MLLYQYYSLVMATGWVMVADYVCLVAGYW